jgi:hypothetical protein
MYGLFISSKIMCSLSQIIIDNGLFLQMTNQCSTRISTYLIVTLKHIDLTLVLMQQ